jgi:hypothetical protein
VGPEASARALMRAALRSDLEKRFGHDLDPLEGGGAPRHRSCTYDWRGQLASWRRGAGTLPRHSGVLNKGLGFDRPPQKRRSAGQKADRLTPAKRFPDIS